MKMKKDNENNNIEAKERILNASIQLFSEKGYDATSVTEIAKSANVTKTLIYYYFDSKETILNILVDSILEKFTSITMDFIHENIVQMIEEGRLDIKTNRLRFTSEEDTSCFLRNGYQYFEKILDCSLKNREAIRILLSESLKNKKNRHELFNLIISMTSVSSENPFSLIVSESGEDSDFKHSSSMFMFKFFYTIFPLINFAAYYDDYKEFSGQSDEELRISFLQTFKIIASSLFSGNDILLCDEKTEVEE